MRLEAESGNGLKSEHRCQCGVIQAIGGNKQEVILRQGTLACLKGAAVIKKYLTAMETRQLGPLRGHKWTMLEWGAVFNRNITLWPLLVH